MTTMNISLPEKMKEFVDCRVEAGHYGTASEYVRDLIRKDSERQVKERNRPLRIAQRLYRDLDITLSYLGEFASPDAVCRFASAVESTRSHIRHFPSLC